MCCVLDGCAMLYCCCVCVCRIQLHALHCMEPNLRNGHRITRAASFQKPGFSYEIKAGMIDPVTDSLVHSVSRVRVTGWTGSALFCLPVDKAADRSRDAGPRASFANARGPVNRARSP